MPLWDPFVMSGYPIIGDLEAQIFYPINWLFVVVDPFRPLPYRLVEIQLILHFFLAGLFMYFLARSFVEESIPALFGAVLFMSSGAMVAHTEHLASIDAMAWFPLIFLLAKRALLEGSRRLTVLAGIAFGVQILAGHWQHSAYLGVLLFLYFAYEACCGPLRRKLWPKWIYELGIIAGIGAALAMVQIVPSYELGVHSVRSYLTYWDVSAGNEPRFLWTLFLPNFFGGINGVPQWYPYDLSFNYAFLTVPGCLLALLGLIETVRKRNFFWLGAVLLFTELSFGNQGHLAGIVYRIPVLNQFRVMAAFFDVTNFALCLMAAVGAGLLFKQVRPRFLEKYTPTALVVLLLAALALGFILRLDSKIHDWRHALVVLAILVALVIALLRNRLSRRAAQYGILGLTLFELCFFSMNQKFNCAPGDPGTFLSHDYAVGRKESLEFLRKDIAGDFRVAALAEFQWSGNGWNVWRIPGVYGWNPLTLRSYDEYMRGFSHTSNVRLPQEGPDHHFNSPLLDLLGAKYLLLVRAFPESELELQDRSKFQAVFEDLNWWRIYRNDAYFPKVSFYPKAYTMPDDLGTMAFMSSSRFDPRRIVLVGEKNVAGPAGKLAEKIEAIRLRADDPLLRSSAAKISDPYCAEKLPMIGGWGRRGDWIRFEVPARSAPGRYLLAIQYTANSLAIPALGLNALARAYPWYRSALERMPEVEVALEAGNFSQRRGPVSLPRTYGWPCHVSRTAELGELEIPLGPAKIEISSERDTALNVYSLHLIRLPSLPPPTAAGFSYRSYSASANAISFESQAAEDGLVLLNEIHYPGWQATIDGRPAEILRADGIFRSLFVPAGSHHIALRFQPRYFPGAAISIATMMGLLAWGAVLRTRRDGNQHR